jgi:hypothetical protein
MRVGEGVSVDAGAGVAGPATAKAKSNVRRIGMISLPFLRCGPPDAACRLDPPNRLTEIFERDDLVEAERDVENADGEDRSRHPAP